MKKYTNSSEFQFFEPILPERIPEIDLYMDQILTFLSERLYPQNSGNSEKILTKTMINNYSKNKLLPPSKNKKYAQRHILLLILIYHMKQTLSISDIEIVTKMLYEDDEIDFSAIYDSFVKKQEAVSNSLKSTFLETIKMADPAQSDCSKEQVIEKIFELVLEANLQKQLAERLIHFLRETK